MGMRKKTIYSARELIKQCKFNLGKDEINGDKHLLSVSLFVYNVVTAEGKCIRYCILYKY